MKTTILSHVYNILKLQNCIISKINYADYFAIAIIEILMFEYLGIFITYLKD